MVQVNCNHRYRAGAWDGPQETMILLCESCEKTLLVPLAKQTYRTLILAPRRNQEGKLIDYKKEIWEVNK